MRVANAAGRLALQTQNGLVDVEVTSRGRFSATPQEVYERWSEFSQWAQQRDTRKDVKVEASEPTLGPPVPRPGQVFGIGLNYRMHAAEAGLDLPTSPVVFTKFPSCIVGPSAAVPLPAGSVDWEAELVVVIGRVAHRVREANGWDHVAGLTAGQDLSERGMQLAGPAPQFSLAKSFPGFGPIGPYVVTPDEFDDPDDLEIGCCLAGGEILQQGRTNDLIFPVAALIAELSAVCTLCAGDLIFTGTPAGVGAARTPPRFLECGDVLLTTIERIGELRTTFVASREPEPSDLGGQGECLSID